MLQSILQTDFFAFFMIFARVGAAIMLIPGFGESFVTPRIRLMIAIGITIVVAPVVSAGLPKLPDSPIQLFLMMGGEILIGVFIGSMTRFLFFSLQTAGMVIAYQTGLANALVTDPTAAVQGAIFSAFLGILGIVVIFETNLHQLMLAAIVDSYSLFTPGHLPPLDDFSNMAARVVSDSFDLAMRLAAPFLVVGLVFYLGLGLLGRLMPQIQVFFIVLPLQIALGLLVLMLTIGAGMTWFAGSFGDQISNAFIR
ncbi:MAG: flagellar biosynthetic protein FliR [Alphaproteobacteria bacterium]